MCYYFKSTADGAWNVWIDGRISNEIIYFLLKEDIRKIHLTKYNLFLKLIRYDISSGGVKNKKHLYRNWYTGGKCILLGPIEMSKILR